MNKPESPVIEACPTVRLAASELVAVDCCSCGTLRVNLGALTLRITAEGLQAIMHTLGEALIANAGMKAVAGAPLPRRGARPISVSNALSRKAPRGQS